MNTSREAAPNPALGETELEVALENPLVIDLGHSSDSASINNESESRKSDDHRLLTKGPHPEIVFITLFRMQRQCRTNPIILHIFSCLIFATAHLPA